MNVYVLEQVNFYPDVDGRGEIIGVFSSREKAEKRAEEIRPDIEYYLGIKPGNARSIYELVIRTFELDMWEVTEYEDEEEDS